jgi:hypothetical protein
LLQIIISETKKQIASFSKMTDAKNYLNSVETNPPTHEIIGAEDPQPEIVENAGE